MSEALFGSFPLQHFEKFAHRQLIYHDRAEPYGSHCQLARLFIYSLGRVVGRWEGHWQGYLDRDGVCAWWNRSLRAEQAWVIGSWEIYLVFLSSAR